MILKKIVNVLKRPSILFLKVFSYFPKGRLYNAKYFIHRNYLTDTGWALSVKSEMPVDKDGKELPWLSYSFIDFLAPRLNKNLNLLEYGSGNSTIWFSEKINKVVSLEHHNDWFKLVSDKLKAYTNVNIIFKDLESGDYENEILNYKDEFDMVLIDGRKRVNCAKNSLNALKPGGVVIWDDSQREDYNEGYQFLLDSGFKRLDFSGLRPMNSVTSKTSVFYRPENCLGL